MANQRNLKAFVRYDGSGRVVAGSLVLRKNKPKVGRWEEILTYECCNDVPSTTTSTTTSSNVLRLSETACGPSLPSQPVITIEMGTGLCDEGMYLRGDFSQIPQDFYVNIQSVTRPFYKMGDSVAYPGMGGCQSCSSSTTSTTSTSTSTTTASPTTTTTTTASVQQYRISSTGCQGCPNGCSEDLNSGTYVYAQGPAYATPRQLYTDSGLTTPFIANAGNYKLMQGWPSGQAYSSYVEGGQMLNANICQ